MKHFEVELSCENDHNCSYIMEDDILARLNFNILQDCVKFI